MRTTQLARKERPANAKNDYDRFIHGSFAYIFQQMEGNRKHNKHKEVLVTSGEAKFETNLFNIILDQLSEEPN